MYKIFEAAPPVLDLLRKTEKKMTFQKMFPITFYESNSICDLLIALSNFF